MKKKKKKETLLRYNPNPKQVFAIPLKGYILVKGIVQYGNKL